MTRKLAKLPPIPKSIPSIVGPVPVALVNELRDKKGDPCFGIFRSTERDVRLDADSSSTTAWLTYWHEWAHVIFWDAWVKLNKDAEERVCDALATARVREMLDNGGKP